MKALSKAYCHFAIGDGAKVDALWQTVLVSLDEKDNEQIRPFLALMEQLLMVNHPTFSSRIAHFMNVLMEYIHKNEQYQKWVELVIEKLFKVAFNSPLVADWFKQNSKKW